MSLACGGGANGAVDGSVDARKDGTLRVTDAEADRNVADGGADHRVDDAASDGRRMESHFVDAAVRCEGGRGWGPCSATDAAELACEASTDCTWQSNGGTCCGVLTVGVNKSAPFVGCPGLPCPPPRISQPACLLYYTEDCQAVDAAADIVVDCVDHRCLTRARSQ